MSELSFKAYCIENYAEYKNLPSSVVFEKFFNTKLLNHLQTDYEDLHGMGKEYWGEKAKLLAALIHFPTNNVSKTLQLTVTFT